MVQIKINGLLEFPLQTNVFENVRNYLTGEICLAIQTTAMTVQKLINACVLCCLFEADRSVHGRKIRKQHKSRGKKGGENDIYKYTFEIVCNVGKSFRDL